MGRQREFCRCVHNAHHFVRGVCSYACDPTTWVATYPNVENLGRELEIAQDGGARTNRQEPTFLVVAYVTRCTARQSSLKVALAHRTAPATPVSLSNVKSDASARSRVPVDPRRVESKQPSKRCKQIRTGYRSPAAARAIAGPAMSQSGPPGAMWTGVGASESQASRALRLNPTHMSTWLSS